MKTKPEVPNSIGPVESLEKKSGSANQIDPGKKSFVEPEISTPVDVLETTTFFQGADSGSI